MADLCPLTVEAIERSGLARVSRFGSRYLARRVAADPDLAWRIGDDFAIGGFWRDRPEIGEVLETIGQAARPRLLDALVAAFTRRGCRLVLAGLDESVRRADAYRAAGWPVWTEIIFYQLSDLPPAPDSGLAHRPAIRADLPDLVALDRAAFDWFWQEPESALAAALDRPNGFVRIAEVAGRPVGYWSANYRDRSANADRLAVDPAARGRGIGRDLMIAGLSLLAGRGVVTVTLNTGTDNTVARHLYERLGFRPFGAPVPIFGRVLSPGPDLR